MSKKSYNPQALAGITDYSDKEFQQDMKTYEIYIPDELLYSKEMNHFVLKEVTKVIKENKHQGINPNTGWVFTAEEASNYAEENYNYRVEEFKKLGGC